MAVALRALVAASVVAPALSVTPSSAAGWAPQRNTSIVVGVAAGGALDVTARMVQNIQRTHRLVEVPAVVVSKPGAAGAIAWSMLAAREGDGHLLAFATPTLLRNHAPTRDCCRSSSTAPARSR
ncbi:MAG: hypothetical protein IT529_15780 [Burkholderiales bacterium]|nr:hypothetical protein [Burkholderiales bacterium]